jgi:hypothetical protein
MSPRPCARRRGAAGLLVLGVLAPGLLSLAAPSRAGEADVVAVEVTCEEGECLFAVTLRHADDGWDHYADRYEILTPDGALLGTRVLRHPHVDEQPFTRRLPGVAVPEGVSEVRVRAHDSRHGYGGREVGVAIPRDAAEAGTEPAP